MSHRLEPFKNQIESLKAQGLSVRKIAETVGQPPSSVQHYLSKLKKETPPPLLWGEQSNGGRILRDPESGRGLEFEMEIPRGAGLKDILASGLGWVGWGLACLEWGAFYVAAMMDWRNFGGGVMLLTAGVVGGWLWR